MLFCVTVDDITRMKLVACFLLRLVKIQVVLSISYCYHFKFGPGRGWGWGGGGGAIPKILYGETPARGPTLTLTLSINL